MTKQGYWIGALLGGLLLILAADSHAGSRGTPIAPPQSAQPAVDTESSSAPAASLRRARIDPRSHPSLRDAALARGRSIGRRITFFKLGVAVATLVLLVAGQRLARRGRGAELLTTRRVALLMLAIAAFASSYNFFRWRHYDGIHAHEVFHYYLGAKYFSELGYFDLYECTVVALAEARPALADRPQVIRDLRDIDRRRTIVPAEHAPRCRQSFSPARWQQFTQDVVFMRARLPEREWNRVITDQGFNASPAWTLFGRPIAWLIPATDASIQWLVRLDLLLLGAAFAAVAWAFGLQGFCLALITWSINPLSRYEWVGDAFLRQLWFGTAVTGLCLLARRRHAAAAVLLGVSAAARIFPLFFVIGYGLGRARDWLSTKRVDKGFVRFAATGAVTAALLIWAAIGMCGRGPGVLGEFARNMAAYSELKAANSVGLRPLLSYTSREPAPYLIDGQLVYRDGDRQALVQRTFDSRRGFYYAGLAIGLLLFWRALRDAADWEAAALGFVLILLFTQAASYYMTCTVPVALLATRRPRIAIGLMVALAAWCAALLACAETPLGFAWASAIALGLAFFVLWEMRAPALAETAAAGAPAEG